MGQCYVLGLHPFGKRSLFKTLLNGMCVRGAGGWGVGAPYHPPPWHPYTTGLALCCCGACWSGMHAHSVLEPRVHVHLRCGPNSWPDLPTHCSDGKAELLYALKHCLVRHTKGQQLGGEPLLALPELRTENVPGGQGD